MRTNTKPKPTTPQEALLAMRENYPTWRAIATILGMPKSQGYIAKVAQGKKASAKLCHALGVPAPMVLAPLCNTCGGRCLPKRCTAKPRKATPNPYKWMTNQDGKRHKVYIVSGAASFAFGNGDVI